jgi:hypothetical protein
MLHREEEFTLFFCFSINLRLLCDLCGSFCQALEGNELSLRRKEKWACLRLRGR